MIRNYPSLESFLNLPSTNNSDEFKKIVKERYFISRSINTSYNDVGKITPTERKYILEFISDEVKKTQDLIDKKTKGNN